MPDSAGYSSAGVALAVATGEAFGVAAGEAAAVWAASVVAVGEKSLAILLREPGPSSLTVARSTALPSASPTRSSITARRRRPTK